MFDPATLPSFDEIAIQNPLAVTMLSIGHRELDNARPGDFLIFKNLKSLHVEREDDTKVSFPMEFSDLPLEELDVDGFTVQELPSIRTLKKLHIICEELDQGQLDEIPKRFNRLSHLSISSRAPVELSIPSSFSILQDLETLSLDCGLTELPDQLVALKKLRHLDIAGNNFKKFPLILTNLPLEALDISTNPIKELPDEFELMRQLKKLVLKECAFSEFPSVICRSSIEELHLESTPVTLPDDFAKLTTLKRLYFNDSELKIFPEVLKELPELQVLDLSDNSLDRLPNGLANMTNLKELNLGGNKFKTLPKELEGMKNLEVLGMGGNEMTSISLSFENMPMLRELDLSGNKFKKLSKKLDGAKSLEVLYLDANEMTSIDSAFDDLPNLREVSLTRNALKKFPVALTKLSNLEVLNLSGNSLSGKFPGELKHLKKLRRLVLEGFAGRFLTGLEPLQNLEELVCHYTRDLTPIFALKKLKRVELRDTSAKTLSPFSQLPELEELALKSDYSIYSIEDAILPKLRRLDLSSCINLEDVTGIASMPALEELSIDYCQEIEDMMPIIMHPHLRTLIATEEALETWAKREALRKLKPKSEIEKLLTSNDLQSIREGLEQLAIYVSTNSGPRSNAVATFFKLKKKRDELIQIPVLDDLVKKHSKDLQSSDLVNLIKAVLVLITDNFKVTLDAVSLLIARKDVSAQKEVVDIFMKACQSYDSGHREYSQTVHDQFIDELFPKFEGESLATLLFTLPSDFLYRDDMFELFKPALKKLKDHSLEDSVLDYFVEFVHDQEADFIKNREVLKNFKGASKKTTDVISKLEKSQTFRLAGWQRKTKYVSTSDYNLACYAAVAGKKEQALKHLAGAIKRATTKEKSNLIKFALQEPDFATLQDDSGFLALLTEKKQTKKRAK